MRNKFSRTQRKRKYTKKSGNTKRTTQKRNKKYSRRNMQEGGNMYTQLRRLVSTGYKKTFGGKPIEELLAILKDENPPTSSSRERSFVQNVKNVGEKLMTLAKEITVNTVHNGSIQDDKITMVNIPSRHDVYEFQPLVKDGENNEYLMNTKEFYSPKGVNDVVDLEKQKFNVAYAMHEYDKLPDKGKDGYDRFYGTKFYDFAIKNAGLFIEEQARTEAEAAAAAITTPTAASEQAPLPIIIAGATGTKAEYINGVYEPTKLVSDDMPIYKKLGQYGYLEYHDLKDLGSKDVNGAWIWTDVPTNLDNYSKTIAVLSCEKVFPNKAEGTWIVVDEDDKYVKQSNITIKEATTDDIPGAIRKAKLEANKLLELGETIDNKQLKQLKQLKNLILHWTKLLGCLRRSSYEVCKPLDNIQEEKEEEKEEENEDE